MYVWLSAKSNRKLLSDTPWEVGRLFQAETVGVVTSHNGADEDVATCVFSCKGREVGEPRGNPRLRQMTTGGEREEERVKDGEKV